MHRTKTQARVMVQNKVGGGWEVRSLFPSLQWKFENLSHTLPHHRGRKGSKKKKHLTEPTNMGGRKGGRKGGSRGNGRENGVFSGGRMRRGGGKRRRGRRRGRKGGGRRRERRGEDKDGREKEEEVIPHIQPAAMYNGTQYIFSGFYLQSRR